MNSYFIDRIEHFRHLQEWTLQQSKYGYVKIAKMDIDDALAFFVVQCRGAKFYNMASECRMRDSEVTFRRFPCNHYDSFCIKALIPH